MEIDTEDQVLPKVFFVFEIILLRLYSFLTSESFMTEVDGIIRILSSFIKIWTSAYINVEIALFSSNPPFGFPLLNNYSGETENKN